MPFLKDNNERTDSGHSNLGNENQPSRKIDNQFFKKKNIKLMLCIKVSITKWKTEVIIWTIKAQKCKSFCSIIEIFQGKVYLEFFFYVPS